MINIATPPAGRKPLFANSGTFSIPNAVFDDPYFAKEKRVFSRLEALAWIAKHVRWTDNCVLKKGEGQWSLSFMGDAWGWCVSKVRRFLKWLEEATYIRTRRDTASGIAQMVVTYLFSTTYRAEKVVADTAPTVDRHSSDTKTNSGYSGKEDSPCSPQGDDQRYDGSFPGREEPAGAGPSDIPSAPPEQPKQKEPSKRLRAKGSRAAPPPEDWAPTEKTFAKLMAARGVSRRQVELQAERFVNSCIASDNKYGYVKFDAAFINWVTGKHYEEIQEFTKATKPAYDAMARAYDDACPA